MQIKKKITCKNKICLTDVWQFREMFTESISGGVLFNLLNMDQVSYF
jgi:hypothetical protein